MNEAKRLSERKRTCLQWYADKEHVPSPEGRIHVPSEYPFTRREMNWALDNDLLCVGPNGWHVPTPSGRLALNPPTESYLAGKGEL